MTFTALEQILIKFSFLIYSLITLFSWIKITLYQKTIHQVKNSSNKTSLIWKIPTGFGIFLGFISITGLCLIRWNLTDHLPLSNLYESSLFLSWSLIFIYLIFKIKIENEWIDAIIAPIILMTITFSTLGLPKQLQHATSLVPALQSNWLLMHVTMMILSYGALIFGSLLAITLLTITFFKRNTRNRNYLNNLIYSRANLYEENSNILKIIKYIYDKKKKLFLINQIDYWSYRIIGIGFPLLTLGILSGAVWANEAWGSYWSWDPKETWALITWMIFAIYLHTRITRGWNGTKPALVAILGFFFVWMCYLGVNFLGKGLHSYGWLS
jgi:cytochrome c-type biogenesis protein CcsB